jgi:cytochrome P450
MTSTQLQRHSGTPPDAPESHDLGATDDSLDYMARAFRRYGDTFRVYAPSRASWTWIVHHPDDVKHVLVTNHRNYTKGVGIDRVKLLLGNGIMTSEADRWRRQRRMMQPAFHRTGIERFGDAIRRANDAMLERWEHAAASGQTVNLTESMCELALESVLRAIFGEDLDRLALDLHDNPFMVVARQPQRDPKFAFEFRRLTGLVLERLRRRQELMPPRSDLMQVLMEATGAGSGRSMSEREIVDEILTLVVAGHETTASTLCWTWWLIARHPAVEVRLIQEHSAAADVDVRGFDDLGSLPYTRQVLQETMRLYPPGWLLTRRAIGSDRLGGYDVPAGTDVFLSPYLVHRHPGFWDNPERFDPDRFDAARAARRHRFAYIPFGAGPRHCIGENLAVYEMMLHLKGTVRRLRLRTTEPGPVAMEARINLRPARDLHMRVEKR